MIDSLKGLLDKKAVPKKKKMILKESVSSVAKNRSFKGPASPNGVFVSLKSDFGIKRLFINEEGKEDFTRMINALVEGLIPPVEDIQFENNELVGMTKYERTAVLDIFFNDKNARTFNLEMQQNRLYCMLKRYYCYACRYHSEIMQPGKEYEYDLSPITGILIADFSLPELKSDPCISLHQIGNMEKGEVTVDSTQILTVELPKFNKTIEELNGEKDVFLYLLSHMGELEEIPQSLDNNKYRPLFERARIANFNKEDMKRYNAINKAEETRRLEIKSGEMWGEEIGWEKGLKKGMEKNRTEMVIKLIEGEFASFEEIAEIANITLPEVEEIAASLTHV